MNTWLKKDELKVWVWEFCLWSLHMINHKKLVYQRAIWAVRCNRYDCWFQWVTVCLFQYTHTRVTQGNTDSAVSERKKSNNNKRYSDLCPRMTKWYIYPLGSWWFTNWEMMKNNFLLLLFHVIVFFVSDQLSRPLEPHDTTVQFHWQGCRMSWRPDELLLRFCKHTKKKCTNNVKTWDEILYWF